MTATRQISNPLPSDRAEVMDRWFREQMLPGHAEYLADPPTGAPAEAIPGRTKARRDRRNASGIT